MFVKRLNLVVRTYILKCLCCNSTVTGIKTVIDIMIYNDDINYINNTTTIKYITALTQNPILPMKYLFILIYLLFFALQDNGAKSLLMKTMRDTVSWH